MAQGFGPIGEATLQDIADALDGDIDKYLRETRGLESEVRKARIKLETAKGLQKVGE